MTVNEPLIISLNFLESLIEVMPSMGPCVNPSDVCQIAILLLSYDFMQNVDSLVFSHRSSM